jgi:hypothetical protein
MTQHMWESNIWPGLKVDWTTTSIPEPTIPLLVPRSFTSWSTAKQAP